MSFVPSNPNAWTSGEPVATTEIGESGFLALESGGYLLLQSGDRLLLHGGATSVGSFTATEESLTWH